MQPLNTLIAQCINNDRKAQKALYEQHFQYLIHICYRYEHNYQDAVALVNQVFLKILNNLQSFDTTKPFLPWIKRIAVNEALDHLRRNQKHLNGTVLLDDDGWDRETDREDVMEDTDHLSYEDYLAILSKLPKMEQTVFNLYAIDDYPHKEIAAMLNISERSSKRYLQRARELLQKMINEKRLIMKGV
jgi:RNA polymerase sigma-70 factor (ECF subfamily)